MNEKKATFWLTLQNMSQGELLQHVPPDELKEIQQKHERIEAYKVAHPGESKTTVVGLGQRILKWSRETLNSIWEKIIPGIPIFHLHNADNKTKGRKAIGKVLKTIKTNAGDIIAIIRRFYDSLNIETDVASFEAPLETNANNLQGHEVQPHELGDITAIALGHSDTCRPAFSGAKLLADLQCFVTEEKEAMDLHEVIKFIQENKTPPLEIFSESTIMNLPIVQASIEEKKGNKNLYEQNKRLEAELKVAQEAHQKELDEMQQQLEDSRTNLTKFQAQEKFKELLGQRKSLTEPQTKFIEMKKEELSLDPEKDLDGQINSFFDTHIKEFEKLKPIFNPGQDEKENKEQNAFDIPTIPTSDEWAEISKILPE